jgi:hypothetical protein
MPVRQSTVGVGLVSSSTFFPLVPVEQGRDRGVSSLTLITNGTASAVSTNPAATVSERPNDASGLTVNATAAAGVVTSLSVVAAGLGYRIGDIVTITVTGATAPVTASVTGLTG